MKSKLNPGKDMDDGLLVTGKGTKAVIMMLQFDPTAKVLVAACVNEINFITYDGGVLKKTKGVFGSKFPPQTALSIAFIDSNAVMGLFKGQISLWKGNSMINNVDAHDGPVYTVCSRKKDKGVISGGKDGNIIIWVRQPQEAG